MADPYADADAANKAQQAALLQAIAEQGSKGKALFEQQQADATAQRQAAVDGALQRTTQINAPTALGTQLSAQAAAPADQRSADIAQASDAYTQDIGRMTASNNNYMNEVSASLPALKTYTDAKVADINAAREQSAAQAALQRELAQMQLEGQRLSLQGQRESLAAKSNPTLNPPTVEEQKYAQAQAQHANQAKIEGEIRTKADPSLQAAFHSLVASNGSVQEALADLDAGMRQPVLDAQGNPVAGQNAFTQMFGNVDTATLQSWLRRFYDPTYNAQVEAYSAVRPIRGAY